jgi:predicted TIM-barrel fold metal-dependent hydrolase
MELSEIPIIDNHANNLLKPEAIAKYPLAAAFTEGRSPEILERHARHSFSYRRSLRDIAALLECEPEESAILAKRKELGWQQLTQICFKAAKLDALLLDDGFLASDILPLEWHQKFVPVRRLLRVEAIAESILPHAKDFETFRELFRAEIDPPPPEVVAFKSIAAYRSGLDIELVAPEEAELNFNAIKETIGEKTFRLNDKTLIDFVVTTTLFAAAKHGIPVQFHTGFGAPDLDLRLANPLHLRPLIEENRFRKAKFVLLHASYPYTREAGYLGSVYPNVYLDFGLAASYVSVSGMRSLLEELLEVTPTTKVMYSSDGFMIPELYYLGAKWGREVLGQVLEGAVADGDLTAREADEVAIAILWENARQLYDLDFLY